MVTASDPTQIQPTIRLAHKLTDQAVAQGKLPKRGEHLKPQESHKRKWEPSHHQSHSSHQQPPRLAPDRAFTATQPDNKGKGVYGEIPPVLPVFISPLWAMRKVLMPKVRTTWPYDQGLQDQATQQQQQPQPQQQQQPEHSQRVLRMWKMGHMRRDCPQLKKAGGGAVKGRAFVIGSGEAKDDPTIVTGKFLLNNVYANILFDTAADSSFISSEFSKLLDIVPIPLDCKYTVELADGKLIETQHIF
ncbi:hypothetical protein E3N88_22960 [Mikania micrantha]|uniref:Reverse transcriptase domain-containing protein n=1 Tax=Mikania micrantha TaxID=192012 RepID=A0A5N6ND06_9ASTR|nr:hypothetical protein E3N88_22960 [Mikania micrantha]